MGNCMSSTAKASNNDVGIGATVAVPSKKLAAETVAPMDSSQQKDQNPQKPQQLWHNQPMSEAHAKGLKEVEEALTGVKEELKSAQGEGGAPKVPRADTLTLAEPGTITPAAALVKLLDGHRRFLTGESAHPHQSEQWLQQLTKTQRPFAAVLSCSDSRVPVETLFDVGFGDVFVCRVAGNIATNEEIGSLEYGVVDLGVSVIMVMGHAKCGACKTALTGKHFPGYIDILVDALGVPVERACAKSGITSKTCSATDMDLLKSVVEENVRYQMERLLRSAVLHDAVEAGKLKVVGGYYHLDSGHVSLIH